MSCTGAPGRPSPLYRPAAWLVAGALAAFTSTTNRVRVYGRVPRGTRSLLVVSNHVHDLDGALVPPRLFLADPWRAHVRAAGAQRLFEPGHLAPLAPAWLRPFLYGFNVGPAIAFLGALPIESDPRRRALRSLAWEILRTHGDVRWRDVLNADCLGALGAKLGLDGADLGKRRVRDAFRPRLGPVADEPVPLADLREPFRSEVGRATRSRVEGQLARIETALAAGDTVYITPEGRLTPDGRVQRLREILDRLLPRAGRVIFAALAYDTFTPGQLGIHLRWVEPGDADRRARLHLSLAAARPVTASQVAAAALVRLGGDTSEKEWVAACAGLAESLPERAFLVPELRGAGARRRYARVIRHMAARGLVERISTAGSDARAPEPVHADGPLYRLREGARDPRFPHVGDIVAYQASMLGQTLEACQAPG